MITGFISCNLNHKLRICRLRRFQPCLFSATESFIPVAYCTKNRRRKLAPENELVRFLERVSLVIRYGAALYAASQQLPMK